MTTEGDDQMDDLEKVDAVVIGAGQAGLSSAYELARRGVSLVVLEAGGQVGNQWRSRWDSLRLFTPARFDGLPGSKFPAPADSFPDKNQLADYLEAYGREHHLPIRTGVRALSLERSGDGYRLETSAGAVAARHVVVATGYQGPKIPTLAADIKPEIRQLHASGYKNASQLSGDVLVVGAGTSGVEIAIEAAGAGHKTVLAGRGTGAIPPIFYAFEGKFFWFYANKIASVGTPMGRRMKPLVLHHGAPLIRVTMREALAAGVERAPRVTAVDAGLPVCDGGRRLQPETIVWCTGFARDYSWIRFPVVGADGYPTHVAGVADGEKGLYFMGLPFQTRLASGLIGGQGPDATFVAETIAKRLAEARQVALPTSAPVAA
ncbi:MAG: flavin-containing monooxygenase [Candidatus Dormibacterales bacterium]